MPIPQKTKQEAAADYLTLAQELEEMKAVRAVDFYKPYGPQIDFHSMGLEKRERLFMAGNQLGKTYAGACEAAYHLTGEYPKWWKGRRFNKPIIMLAGSRSSELTRDGVQRLLIGPPADEAAWGSGMIPKDAIVDRSRRQGVSDALDTVVVKHKSGGNSILQFKSYDQGREKWQAATVHVVWFDEEPPYDVYSEGMTRTTATKGIVYVTFTPLLGMSEVVRRYIQEPGPTRDYIQMGIEDAGHIPEEERAQIIEDYPPHEREARARGIPMLGSGLIFPFAQETMEVTPFEIPRFWPMLAGMDFGIQHPTAVVWFAWDRDSDTMYLTNVYSSPGSSAVHASAIRARGLLVPIAWPHDGEIRSKETGETLANYYRTTHQLNMMPTHAAFSDQSISVERGISEMTNRMETGRWKVFSTANAWFDEVRMYHRKDGKIVKENDDLIDASRYAMMMLNYAKTVDQLGRNRRRRNKVATGMDYDVLGQ